MIQERHLVASKIKDKRRASMAIFVDQMDMLWLFILLVECK